MKKYFSLLTILLISFVLQAQVDFDTYFEPKTLRFDYLHAGNSDTSYIFFEQMKEEKYWSGSQTNLIDKFNYGNYMYKVYNAKDNKLIFSRGFNTLFLEWRTTTEAKILSRSFYESIVMPYPKNKIRIVIEERDKKNIFHTKFEMEISPNDFFIKKEKIDLYPSSKVVDNGEPKNKVDIVFIPEGYTKDEMDKFAKDVKRFAGYLFSCSPFEEHKKQFNIWKVDAPSVDSGTDLPGKNVWKNTICNSNFYTFGTERYLTTKDIKSVRDIAAYTPYDQIYILVNTEKYGGGGIYNHYNLCTSNHKLSDFVFVHELGHGFVGLGDEYYTSDVATNDLYPTDVEPYEANLTTLVEFDKKWKNMLDKDTPVPTPNNSKYADKLGVFEGGGYVSRGVYRPKASCTMKDTKFNAFCPVCQRAIIEMIKFYTE